MEWEEIFKFLITSGILAAIVAALIKFGLKWIGDKLGWDETKRHKAATLLADVAEKAMRAAEQSAKHNKFESAKDQSIWKENYAVDMIMKLAGVENGLAKSVLRAVFNVSSLNEGKPSVTYNEVHKFEEEEVTKIVEKLLGDK